MKNEKGFTLIELVVVIMVTVLLVTILLPALTTAADKEKSFRAVCANRLKNFGMANTIYANEYDGAYCPAYYWDPNAKGSPRLFLGGENYDAVKWTSNRVFREILKLDSYPKNKRNAPVPGSSTYSAYNSPDNMPTQFLCPADRISIDWLNQRDGTLTSYAYNFSDWCIPNDWTGMFNKNLYMGHNAADMPAPSTKLAFIDAIDWWVAWETRSADYTQAWAKYGQAGVADFRSGKYGYFYGPVLYRHNEGANIAFYDGHVKYMRKQQIFVMTDFYQNGDGFTELCPYDKKPGMWVADLKTYMTNQKNGGKSCY